MTSFASFAATTRALLKPTVRFQSPNTSPVTPESAPLADIPELKPKLTKPLRHSRDHNSSRQYEHFDDIQPSAKRDALANESLSRAKRAPSVIQSDFFVAEVRSLGLAQGGPSASLTWHCLAMTELLSEPPQVVVVTERGAQIVDGASLSPHQLTSNEEQLSGSDDFREGTSANADELADLQERLEKAENEAEEAKLAVQKNEKLIADLKAQLDASTAACQDLLETVKEQEDTIEKLS